MADEGKKKSSKRLYILNAKIENLFIQKCAELFMIRALDGEDGIDVVLYERDLENPLANSYCKEHRIQEESVMGNITDILSRINESDEDNLFAYVTHREGNDLEELAQETAQRDIRTEVRTRYSH